MALELDILPARYHDPEEIARGAMGDIYLATDATLGRRVAVKVLAERYAADESLRRRFTREARAAARLSGEPNTVTIYDVGEHHDRPFLVMEYLSGGTLDDVLRRERAQPPQRALTWLEQGARALDAAHKVGIVHRDVKPANLLLDRDGVVHVADFGIASAAGMDSLTVTGTVLGTAGYLSPEQAQGERATPASDRYALGVVAFELLTGARPFQADNPTAEAAAHVQADVPSLCERNRSLPCELDPVFERALAKEPADRYTSCCEFVAALRAAFANAAATTRPSAAVGQPPPPRWSEHLVTMPPRPRRSAAALVILLLLGVVAGALAAYFVTRGHGSHASGAPQPSVAVSTTLRTATTTPAAAPAGTNGHALNDAGFAKMRAGDYLGALPLLQQAVQQLRGVGPSDPYEAYANYNLGYTLLHLNRCADAIPYLRRAQRLEPQRPEPGRDLARARLCA